MYSKYICKFIYTRDTCMIVYFMSIQLANRIWLIIVMDRFDVNGVWKRGAKGIQSFLQKFFSCKFSVKARFSQEIRCSSLLCDEFLREAIFHRVVFSEYPLLDLWYELLRPSSVLRRVPSLAFARMMFLSSSGKCPCLSRYSSSSTHISFRSRASNLIGETPESTLAAALVNVRHPLIMRKFILHCTAPICLSTKYAGM